MAFRGGVRRALNEAALWLAFAGAGAASFYFFEDFYRALERRFPGLEANVTSAPHSGPQVTVVAPGEEWRDSVASVKVTHSTSGLRASLTGLDTPDNTATRLTRSITLAANVYGHYIVEAEINGAKVELLTDTGATYVALNYQSALQLGFTTRTLRFSSRSTTANGIARVAPVTLDHVRIGSIVLRDVKAVVAEPGKMTQNLLGMSFINRLSGFKLSSGRLVMIQQLTP